MEPINLDPVEEEIPVDLDTGPAPAITAETASARAFKVAYALDKTLGKDRPEIQQKLQDGGEAELRTEAAGAVQTKRMEETQTKLTDLLSKKQGPVTPEEIKGVQDLASFMNAAVDPGSVFEESYATKLMSEADSFAEAHPSSDFAKAKKDNPEELAGIQKRYSEFGAKLGYMNTMLEDINDELKQQSYLGYGIDLAKGFIPGSTDYYFRGNVPGVGKTEGGSLAANIDKQRQELLATPWGPEFKLKLAHTMQYLRENNPQRAVEFLHDLIGQSTTDAVLNNIALPLDIATSGGATIVGKTVKGAAIQMAKSDVRKAVGDLVKAGSEPNASRSSIAEGIGDLKEAAVVKATTNITEKLSGINNATKQAIESVDTAFRTDRTEFLEGAAKAGTSKELVNRVVEQDSKLVDRIIKIATEGNKVDRLPGVLESETAVRDIIDDMPNLYPGLRNTILDTQIRKDKLTTNIMADMILGNEDGTYFTSRQVAENYINFHRFNNMEIEQGLDPMRRRPVYYLPESSVKTVSGEANPKFGYEVQDGKARFYSDIGNRVEIVPSGVPKEGFIPVEVEGSRVLFREPVAKVEQQGMGYYVKLSVPVPETSKVIRDAIAETGHSKMPDSPLRNFVTSILGKANLRSPEEVLSEANRQNRLAVTFGPSAYFEIMKDNVKEITKLSAGRFSPNLPKRKKWEEWQRMLEHANKKIDPATGEPGYFYKSPVDFSTDYVQVLGRLPDEQEIAAYFEFKRGMEVDRMFRNMAAVRNQQRVGAMTNRIVSLDKEGKEVKSKEFSGIARRDFPGGDGNILIDDGKGNQVVKAIKDLSSADKKEYSERVKNGEQRVLEIHDPERRPLNGFGNITDERIQYVMSPTVETRALDWNQVPRRGGGHVQYDYDFYVKQAKIHHDRAGNRHWYEGDTTIIPIQYMSMGKDIAKHLDQVRKLLRAKDVAGAEAYSTQHLPFEWEKVDGWFNGVKGAPPMLNMNEPIQVVGRGESIIGKDKNLERRYSKQKGDGRFKDGTTSNSLARQQQIEFSGERDAYELMSIEDVGTRGNPIYKAVPAKTVDPITTMQRGLQRIVKSNFYDDYKTMSVEHWLKEAAPYLEASDAKIKYSPFYYYNEAKFKKNVPADIKARLETAKYQIDQIVGMPSDTENLLYQYSQNVSDYVYQKLGPNAPVVVPSWLVSKLRDPFAFVRSMVFHAKLGLFNVPQFFVQANNYANIFGVAGYKYAAPGTLAAQLHFWSRANSSKEILDHLDKMATKFNMPGSARWRPGELKESIEELEKTGFHVAGREHAMLDDPMSTKVISDGKDTFLNWGTAFFRGGEQNARLGAWHTAYKEFRDKNSFGAITDANRAAILQRADILNVNMSRASATAMNQGVWSVPTQFYGYQQRLLSLFFSSRITGTERARLLAWNAALYGMPMAAGVTGLPVVEWMRKEAIDNGYVVGDNFLESMIGEGLPSALIALATGGGDVSKGTFYDIGPRFGTKGLEFIGNAGTPDKSYLDIAGGAAYSMLKSTIGATDGLRRVILGMVTRDPDVFPATTDDFTDPLREISSVNSAFRILAATEFSRWVSKNDAYLADSSPIQSIVAGVFGVKDQVINDMQTKNNALKQQRQYQDAVEKSFQKDFRRGMLANKAGDYETGESFLKRANRWLDLGGFREDRIPGIIGKALDDNQSIVDKTDMRYYIKEAPKKEIENKTDAFSRTLQIQERKQR